MAIDLDATATWAKHKRHSAIQCESGDRMILTLIAELRAAREVVEDAALFLMALDDPEPLAHWTERRHRMLAKSVAAYDEVAGPREVTAKQPTEAQPP